MQGTIYNRNVFHRLGDAWQAFKATPTPAQLYPPHPNIQTGYLTFPGWSVLEAQGQGNNQDERRVRKAIQSPSVFANMRAIATEFASSELVVKERIDAKLEDVENHPLELLWEAPNPDMGRSFLMMFWAWSYTMSSKAYLYWLPAGGSIKEVWPIPPFMITPVPDAKEFIGGYAFRSRPDAKPIMIPREYITYSRSPNLFDIRDGLSFLVAGMTPIESEIAMGFWNRNFFDENNGIPDGMISVNKDTLDSDLARIRQEIRDFFGGTKRGLAIARETDMKYQAWGRTQKDAEFVEGIKLASTQIGRLMGFPDGYWSESANRANAEQARATMIAGAVWPLLVALHEDMNAGVVKRWWGAQYRAEFKDIRPEDRQLKIAEGEYHKTHWTIDELREADGKDPIGDVRGAMLVAEIAKGTPIPATPASDETEDRIAEMEEEAEALEEPLPEEEGAIPLDAETPPLEEGGTVEEIPMKSVVYHGHFGDIVLTDDLLLDAGYTKTDEGWLPPKPLIPELDDLHKWERKAIKALKAGRSAAVRFDTNAVSLPEQDRIKAALKEAKTVEEVKAAFDGVDSLLDDVDAEARAWVEEATQDE